MKIKSWCMVAWQIPEQNPYIMKIKFVICQWNMETILSWNWICMQFQAGYLEEVD